MRYTRVGPPRTPNLWMMPPRSRRRSPGPQQPPGSRATRELRPTHPPPLHRTRTAAWRAMRRVTCGVSSTVGSATRWMSPGRWGPRSWSASWMSWPPIVGGRASGSRLSESSTAESRRWSTGSSGWICYRPARSRRPVTLCSSPVPTPRFSGSAGRTAPPRPAPPDRRCGTASSSTTRSRWRVVAGHRGTSRICRSRFLASGWPGSTRRSSTPRERTRRWPTGSSRSDALLR
jgi:hypothetical protein